MRKTLLAVPAAVFSIALITGCGNDDSSDQAGTGGGTESAPATEITAGSTAGPEHNDADIAFAQQMIPHHEQAVEMSALAETRAGSQEVKELAASIEAAQQPEIDLMTGWLTEWDAPASAPSSDGGTDHGGHDGPGDSGMGMGEDSGMMSDEDMTQMEAASGSDFDSMFLEMMIEHHDGAITMAQTEQAEGQNEVAIALAKKIEQDQTAEIETMKSLQ